MENIYQGKRLLLFGGASQCIKVVDAAKRMGVYTIVADRNPEAPAAKLADEILPVSVLDTEKIIDYCRKTGVDGVLNHNVDTAQFSHYLVCSALGLPCYGSREAYEVLTDKRKFKALCVENGLSIIPTYDPEHSEAIEYPVLVKPTESAGAMGSSVCFSQEELLAALDKARDASRSGDFIIEKYMAGYPDFYVNYLVIDEEPHLIRIGDRFVGRREDGLDRQCVCGRQPSRHVDFYLDKLDRKMRDFVKKTGVTNGPVSFQGFIDGETVRWYDPTIRFNGSEYESFLKQTTGLDLIEPMIGFALSGKIDFDPEQLRDSFRLNGSCAIQLFIDVGPGVITSVEGFDEIQAMPEVTVIRYKHQIGDLIRRTGDVKQRFAEVGLVVKNEKDAVKNAVRAVQARARILDEHGESMIVSPLDADIL